MMDTIDAILAPNEAQYLTEACNLYVGHTVSLIYVPRLPLRKNTVAHLVACGPTVVVPCSAHIQRDYIYHGGTYVAYIESPTPTREYRFELRFWQFSVRSFHLGPQTSP